MIVSVRCSEQWQRSNGVPDVPVCRRSCFTHVSSTFDRFSTILTNKLIFSRCRVRIFHPTSVIRRFLSPRIMYRVACNEYRDLWGQVSRTIEQISGGVVIAAAAAAAAAGNHSRGFDFSINIPIMRSRNRTLLLYSIPLMLKCSAES